MVLISLNYLIVELPDMPGVWTLEDDQIALKGDAREIEELDEKHGFNASASRAKFLRVWRKRAKEISR
jgi:TRF2-interacting telomeric protein/Rap1 - C terminal domain